MNLRVIFEGGAVADLSNVEHIINKDTGVDLLSNDTGVILRDICEDCKIFYLKDQTLCVGCSENDYCNFKNILDHPI